MFLRLGIAATVLTLAASPSFADARSDARAQVEFGIKVAYDDSGALGGAALKPYGLVAFELSDDGQADAGASRGTYVELGVAPGYAGSRASIAFANASSVARKCLWRSS